MRTIAVLALLVALVAAEVEVIPTFDEFLVQYNKQYDSAEYDLHKHIYENNVADVIAHNADSRQAYKKGINQFTDMTEAEFSQYLGNTVTLANQRRMALEPAQHPTVPLDQLPDSVDWRDKGVVTPVKNQGACGSCWAFATVEGVESAVMRDAGKLLTLSAQDVTSCTKNPQHCGGTGGCGGATYELGYEQVAKDGIASEADYPYIAQTGTCKTTIKKTAKIRNYVKLIENNYTDLMNAIATVGPIAVSVDAGSWGSYRSGVFTGCPGTGRNVIINHAVQLVGYGVENNNPYWLVRNSWGASWGDRGYIKILRHTDGDKSKWCNPDPRPQDGTACDGGPTLITVCGSCGIWYDSSYAVGGSVL
jgi:cathepsin L